MNLPQFFPPRGGGRRGSLAARAREGHGARTENSMFATSRRLARAPAPRARSRATHASQRASRANLRLARTPPPRAHPPRLARASAPRACTPERHARPPQSASSHAPRRLARYPVLGRYPAPRAPLPAPRALPRASRTPRLARNPAPHTRPRASRATPRLTGTQFVSHVSMVTVSRMVSVVWHAHLTFMHVARLARFSRFLAWCRSSGMRF